jgi:hypothetical protein
MSSSAALVAAVNVKQESLPNRWRNCLAASLETWAHQLLYARHVYPPTTFAPCVFFGVACHAHRHPRVVAYIHDMVEMAVASFTSHVADAMTLTIVDDTDNTYETTVVESYKLHMTLFPFHELEDDDVIRALQLLERTMRDVILKVKSLPSERPSHSPSLSFRLLLHIPHENKTCTALNTAFGNGTLMVEGEGDSSQRKRFRRIAPLFRKSTGSCTVSLVREVYTRNHVETIE